MSKGNRTLFIADYCFTPFEHITDTGILCEDEKILAVGDISAFEQSDSLNIIDARGSYAVPGFIDAHIHGAGGFDSTLAWEEDADITNMCKILASHGVTSFVPTIVSAPKEKMLEAISALAKFINDSQLGAEPIAIHVEGPFLNVEKHGSQRANYIIPVDLEFAKEMLAAGKGKIKIMTFAPELDNSIKLVEFLRENDIIPSMGHTIAGEKEVLKAVEAGALRCTHLFNGMPPLHQRNITLTTVALTDDRITIELIIEGSVLHPKMVELACRAKPADKVIGVSDAIEGAGLKDGRYHLGDEEIEVKNGFSITKDGAIAGTTMTLEVSWNHMVTYTHLNRTEAVASFTVNPAKDLNLTDRGIISPDKLADIVFFDSKNHNVKMTVKNGKVVYKA